MEIKKFNNIEEFMNSKEFKNKNLSYCDLSNLDLSGLDQDTWRGFLFFHTNFSNTNINFDPYCLKKETRNYIKVAIAEYCNFSNCSTLIHGANWHLTSIVGSNFTNTNFTSNQNNFVYFKNGIKEYLSYDYNAFETFKQMIQLKLIDIDVIATLPQMPFNSMDIYNLIHYSLPSIEKIHPKDYELYDKIIDKALKEDKKREGFLYKFYNLLDNGRFSIIDKIYFFKGIVLDKEYAEIDFTNIPYFLFTKIIFQNCKFEQITFPKKILDIDGQVTIIDVSSGQVFKDKKNTYSIIPYIVVPGLNMSSWRKRLFSRMGSTCFTIRTDLYLELGRTCNAHCFFCRNQFLEPCQYDREAIIEGLNYLNNYRISSIVIGGGEPTLMKEELKLIFPKSRDNYKHYISTNGICDLQSLLEIGDHYNINLSRHAIEDEENNKIFGKNTIGIEEIRYLFDAKYSRNSTLVATCIKGGLDTVESLDKYIELSDYVNANRVLFQTLHEDLNCKETIERKIDERIFYEVIKKLKEEGYHGGEIPIYSTGNYKMILLKSPDKNKTIAFKFYITQNELEKEWYHAAKRTFDLSMAPNGDIYENWNQTSEPILIKKK